jgi:hypothetical protein
MDLCFRGNPSRIAEQRTISGYGYRATIVRVEFKLKSSSFACVAVGVIEADLALIKRVVMHTYQPLYLLM